MDPAEYEQINAEIAEVIAGISPIERIYHLNKVGLKFMELLDDYNWSCTYTSSTTAEVQVLQNALPSRQNIDNKILMWMIHSGSMDGPTSASPTTQKAKKRA